MDKYSLKSNMPEPTMFDLYQLMQRNATKDDIEEIKTRIDHHKADTDEKIDTMDKKVNAMSD